MDEASVKLPTETERTNSALMHVVSILPLGIIITIVLLVTQGKTSAFALRHGRQSLAWQLVQTVFSAIVGAVYAPFYFQAFFQTMPVFAATTSEPDPGAMRSFYGLLVVYVGVMLCGSAVFYVTSLIQAAKAMRGQPAMYPVIGKIVERLMSPAKS